MERHEWAVRLTERTVVNKLKPFCILFECRQSARIRFMARMVGVWTGISSCQFLFDFVLSTVRGSFERSLKIRRTIARFQSLSQGVRWAPLELCELCNRSIVLNLFWNQFLPSAIVFNKFQSKVSNFGNSKWGPLDRHLTKRLNKLIRCVYNSPDSVHLMDSLSHQSVRSSSKAFSIFIHLFLCSPLWSTMQKTLTEGPGLQFAFEWMPLYIVWLYNTVVYNNQSTRHSIGFFQLVLTLLDFNNFNSSNNWWWFWLIWTNSDLLVRLFAGGAPNGFHSMDALAIGFTFWNS